MWQGCASLKTYRCVEVIHARKTRAAIYPRGTAHAVLLIDRTSQGQHLFQPLHIPQDIKRIKTEGPVIDDLVITALQQWTDKEEKEVNEDAIYAWVPPSVLGSGVGQAEPPWGRLSRMSYVELLQGLKKRNWTNELYDKSAPAWKLSFYQARENLSISDSKTPAVILCSACISVLSYAEQWKEVWHKMDRLSGCSD